MKIDRLYDTKALRQQRFVLQMHEDLHRQLKTAAAISGISMSLLMHKALYQYLRRDKEIVKIDNE